MDTKAKVTANDLAGTRTKSVFQGSNYAELFLMTRHFSITGAALLSGCASIASGIHQEIAVAASPTGASCELTRQGETLRQVTTPVTVAVRKTRYDIAVACALHGYETTTAGDESGVGPGYLETF